MNDVLTLILGRRARHAALSAHPHALETGGAARRQVPAHRHPDQQLPARRPQAHLRADTVQLRVAQPPRRADLPPRHVLGRLRRSACRRTDARQLGWFQGTADAVRQAARHFKGFDADYFLILAGDHLYRMDFFELIESHIEGRADITIAAQPVSAVDATQMGILKFDDLGQISGFEEKPTLERARRQSAAASRKARSPAATTPEKPFVASMGIYVFNREVLLEMLEQPGIDFGKEIIPKAISTHIGEPVHLPRLLGGRRDHRLVLRSEHPADAARRAVQLLSSALADLYPSAVSAGDAASSTARSSRLSSPRAAISIAAHSRARSSASGRRSARRRRSPDRCCLAPTSTRRTRRPTPSRSASAATSSWIASSSTRTRGSATVCGSSTRAGVQEADGDGYYIRNGIIIVPKGAQRQPPA